MTNNASATPKTFRDIIRSAVTDYIGEYKFRDSRPNVEAIAVGNPPNDAEVINGIEVILPVAPNRKSTQGGGSINHDEYWEVYLVDHSNNPSNFYLAIQCLSDTFPRTRGENIPQSSITGSLPTYLLVIRYGRSYDL